MIPYVDLIHPNGINCILARDKLNEEHKYSDPQSTANLFETIKKPISELNTLENEYDSEYLSSRKDRKKHKILVVEDRDKNRNYLCSILQTENFQVIEAEDSDTAIKLAYSEVPDLIICELLMPIVNGYDVIASLCHSKVISDILLLFITAHLQSDDSKILSIFNRQTIELLTKEKLLKTIYERLDIAIKQK